MDISRYKGRFIAKGQFGRVYTSKKHTNRVIKITNKTQNYLQEIEMLKKVESDFVIRLWEWQETSENLILEMEAMWGGDLYTLVYKNLMDLTFARDVYRQIILAIRYIHKKEIIHRDIKLENVLLSRKGKVKLADFAFAIEFQPINAYPDEIISEGKFYRMIGTLPYFSPEMVNKTGYHKETDIWSSGVILHEMVTGYLPFTSDYDYEILHMISTYNFPPVQTSNKFRTLLTGVLNKDPEKRWTVEEILSHL